MSIFKMAPCPEGPSVKTPGSAATTFRLNGVAEVTPLYVTFRFTLGPLAVPGATARGTTQLTCVGLV